MFNFESLKSYKQNYVNANEVHLGLRLVVCPPSDCSPCQFCPFFLPVFPLFSLRPRLPSPSLATFAGGGGFPHLMANDFPFSLIMLEIYPASNTKWSWCVIYKVTCNVEPLVKKSDIDKQESKRVPLDLQTFIDFYGFLLGIRFCTDFTRLCQA